MPVCCSFKYNFVPHSHHHSNHLSALSSQGPLTPLIHCLFLLLLFFAPLSSSLTSQSPHLSLVSLSSLFSASVSSTVLHGFGLLCHAQSIPSNHALGVMDCVKLKHSYVCTYACTWPLVCVCMCVCDCIACVCPLFFLMCCGVWCACACVCPCRSPVNHLQQPDNSACWWRWARCTHVPGTAVWALLQRPPHPQHGCRGTPAHPSGGQRTAGWRHAVLLHHPTVKCCSWRQPLWLRPLY